MPLQALLGALTALTLFCSMAMARPLPPAAAGAPALPAGSCSILREPSYVVPGEEPLPLCAKQRIFSLTKNEWVEVGREPGQFGFVGADAAYAWFRDAANPQVDTSVHCTGEISREPARCWGGDRVHRSRTLVTVMCCPEPTYVCFVKTGACAPK